MDILSEYVVFIERYFIGNRNKIVWITFTCN